MQSGTLPALSTLRQVQPKLRQASMKLPTGPSPARSTPVVRFTATFTDGASVTVTRPVSLWKRAPL